MAEVQVIAAKSSGEALARLVAQLQQSVARGEDLGARDQHVRAAANNLMVLAIELRAACEALTHQLDRLGAKAQDEIGTLYELAELAEEISRIAQNFPKQQSYYPK